MATFTGLFMGLFTPWERTIRGFEGREF